MTDNRGFAVETSADSEKSSEVPSPPPYYQSVDSMVVTSSSSDNQTQPAKKSSSYKVYKTRWYILLLFSSFGFAQSYIYNMWGPIQASMKKVMGWSDTELTILPFYGTIFLALLSLPNAWVLEKIGPRKLLLIMSGATSLAALVRCIPTVGTLQNILINVSALTNAVAGSITMFMPPYLSSRWFPPNERRLATAIGELLNVMGISLAFVVGPAIVSEPESGATIATMRQQYFSYTYGEAAVVTGIFILIIIYFPAAPKRPPSESATVNRIDLLPGVQKLVVSKDFWLLTFTWMLCFGTYAGWIPVLGLDLSNATNGTNHTIDQNQAGWIGFWTSVGGSLFGFVVGKLADMVGHLKAIQLIICILSALSAIWLLLLMKGYLLAFSIVQVYASAISLGMFATVLAPVTFELAAESLYPIDEPVVVGLLSSVGIFWASVFLMVFFFKNVGTGWMDWFLAAAVTLSVVPAALVKAKYKRSLVDKRRGSRVATGGTQ